MGTFLFGAIAVTLIGKVFYGLFSTFVWGNFSYIISQIKSLNNSESIAENNSESIAESIAKAKDFADNYREDKKNIENSLQKDTHNQPLLIVIAFILTSITSSILTKFGELIWNTYILNYSSQ